MKHRLPDDQVVQGEVIGDVVDEIQPVPEEEGDRIDVSVQMIVPPKMIARVVGPGIEVEVRVTNDDGFLYHDLVIGSLGQLLDQAYEAATPKDDDA